MPPKAPPLDGGWPSDGGFTGGMGDTAGLGGPGVPGVSGQGSVSPGELGLAPDSGFSATVGDPTGSNPGAVAEGGLGGAGGESDYKPGSSWAETARNAMMNKQTSVPTGATSGYLGALPSGGVSNFTGTLPPRAPGTRWDTDPVPEFDASDPFGMRPWFDTIARAQANSPFASARAFADNPSYLFGDTTVPSANVPGYSKPGSPFPGSPGSEGYDPAGIGPWLPDIQKALAASPFEVTRNMAQNPDYIVGGVPTAVSGTGAPVAEKPGTPYWAMLNPRRS